MTAATWNVWFAHFIHNIAVHGNALVERYGNCAFVLLKLELKFPLNELKPLELYNPHKDKIRDCCEHFVNREYRLGFDSFEQFDNSVKALQARVDVANETLSLPVSRKRKAEEQ
jgi:hypothetical protein